MADEGIPSPFMRRIPVQTPVVKHLDIEVNEVGKRSEFLNHMSTIGLLVVGWGAVWAFTAYPARSPSDIAGTVALIAWMSAACMAITEHSHEAAGKKATKDAQKIIKEAIEQFEKQS